MNFLWFSFFFSLLSIKLKFTCTFSYGSSNTHTIMKKEFVANTPLKGRENLRFLLSSVSSICAVLKLTQPTHGPPKNLTWVINHYLPKKLRVVIHLTRQQILALQSFSFPPKYELLVILISTILVLLLG